MKAQILLFVMFVMAIAGVFGVLLADMWEKEQIVRSTDRDTLIAFYLAQAGVERAKVEILYAVDLVGDSASYSDLDDSNDNYNFYYSFNVAISGTQRTLIGRGDVYERRLDSSDGTHLAHRRIYVEIDGIVDNVDNVTGMPPPDGIDDDFDDNSQVTGTWQEI